MEEKKQNQQIRFRDLTTLLKIATIGGVIFFADIVSFIVLKIVFYT